MLNIITATEKLHYANAFASPVRSALAALGPSVSEEAVFRFFLTNVIAGVLAGAYGKRETLVLAVGIAATFHGFLHVGPLLGHSAAESLMNGARLTLLFGVPLGVVAARMGLVSAIAFHWVIDFVRFALGL